jgi:predicted DsbA family dithiol-disulfide isomerase
MEATAWSDYCCPWAYVGVDRTRHIAGLAVNVTTLPFELHPEWSVEGIAVRAAGRFGDTLSMLSDLAGEVDMVLNVPSRLPSTRLALMTMEVVRDEAPHRWWAAHEALFGAVWIEGRNLADPVELADLLDHCGIEHSEAIVAAGVEGTMNARVMAAKEAAYDAGATGTPSWWLDDRLLVPGLHTRDQMTNWVERLRARPVSR